MYPSPEMIAASVAQVELCPGAGCDERGAGAVVFQSFWPFEPCNPVLSAIYLIAISKA